jgi:hypothetical protein
MYIAQRGEPGLHVLNLIQYGDRTGWKLPFDRGDYELASQRAQMQVTEDDESGLEPPDFYYPSSHCATAASVTMSKLLRSLSGLSHRLMLTARTYRVCCLILANVTCALGMSGRLQVSSGRSFNENVVNRRFRDFSKRPLPCSPAVIRNSHIPRAAWTVSRSSRGVHQPTMRPH